MASDAACIHRPPQLPPYLALYDQDPFGRHVYPNGACALAILEPPGGGRTHARCLRWCLRVVLVHPASARRTVLEPGDLGVAASSIASSAIPVRLRPSTSTTGS